MWGCLPAVTALAGGRGGRLSETGCQCRIGGKDPIELLAYAAGIGRTDQELSPLAGASLGMGSSLGQEFAYAWLHTRTGETHYFSVLVKFGHREEDHNLMHFSRNQLQPDVGDDHGSDATICLNSWRDTTAPWPYSPAPQELTCMPAVFEVVMHQLEIAS